MAAVESDFYQESVLNMQAEGFFVHETKVTCAAVKPLIIEKALQKCILSTE